jgi:hypothetical protein
MSFEDKIKPIGQYDSFIHCMLVAAPGFGKTVWGGTAPNALFLTTDPEGTISALAFGSMAQEVRIETWTDMNEAYRELRDGLIEKLGLEWVVIDNTSEAKNLSMLESMANARKHNANRDEHVPHIDDHQRSQLQIKAFVKQMHDLPVNVLWTAWRKAEEDSEGESFFTCGVHGQQGLLAQEIQGYMNVVGFGEVEDGERVIYFKQDKPYMGKDRYNALPKIAKVDSVDPQNKGFNVKRMQMLIESAKKKHEASRKTGVAKRPVTTKPLAARRPVTPRKKA